MAGFEIVIYHDKGIHCLHVDTIKFEVVDTEKDSLKEKCLEFFFYDFGEEVFRQTYKVPYSVSELYQEVLQDKLGDVYDKVAANYLRTQIDLRTNGMSKLVEAKARDIYERRTTPAKERI